jgi:hypothetical protein
VRQAVRQNQSRSQTATPWSIPAPVDGWNTEDALAGMKPSFAVVLDNWIPRGGKAEMRRGFIEQVTGTSSPVETLITYSGSSSGDKLFACSGSHIYDVTTAGSLGSAGYSSASSARWNWTNFANDAGRFVLLANGAQAPIKYNGTAFSANAITGTSGSITLVPADLKFVMAHKSRLHWGEKDRLRVWVLDVAAIAGAASLLDLGPVMTKGGSLAGMATWSRDNGAGGADDLAVYVSTKGQVAVYSGSDPTDINSWSLVGVYDVALPIGDRCIVKDGGEFCLLTQEGIIPLSAAVANKRDQQKNLSLSRKVAKAFSDASISYGANTGWQMIYYPGRGSLLVVNVPTTQSAEAMQFVRSSQNGAWCRFVGIPAICWANANGYVYFGGPLGVYRWDVGASDNGEPIVPDVLTAFSDFGNRTRTKIFKMVRASIYAPSIVRPALDVVTDYDQATLPTAVQTTVTPGDISPDDASVVRNEWTGAAGDGYVAAVRMRFALTGSDDVERVAVTQDLATLLLVGPGGSDHILTRPDLPLDVDVSLIGFDVLFEPGGQL